MGFRAERPKRTKLFYKNRWLISVNVVAALRRAGIDCNIVVPAILAEGRPSLQAEPPLTPHAGDGASDDEFPPDREMN